MSRFHLPTASVQAVTIIEFATYDRSRSIRASPSQRALGRVAMAVEALEMVERTPPDLALLDIRLLDGVSGPTVAKHLKRRWGIPAIFVSACLREAYEHSQLAVAITGKPLGQKP
jgi:CheY-like chemotaxis protein